LTASSGSHPSAFWDDLGYCPCLPELVWWINFQHSTTTYVKYFAKLNSYPPSSSFGENTGQQQQQPAPMTAQIQLDIGSLMRSMLQPPPAPNASAPSSSGAQSAAPNQQQPPFAAYFVDFSKISSYFHFICVFRFLQNLMQGLTNNGGMIFRFYFVSCFKFNQVFIFSHSAFQVQFQINNGDVRSAAFTFPTWGHYDCKVWLVINYHDFYDNSLHGNAGDYAWGPGGLDEIVTRVYTGVFLALYLLVQLKQGSIFQLLNQVEGGVPPLSHEVIDNLPEVLIDKEQIGEWQN